MNEGLLSGNISFFDINDIYRNIQLNENILNSVPAGVGNKYLSKILIGNHFHELGGSGIIQLIT